MFRSPFRTGLVFLVLAFGALTVAGQDITGTWNGSMSGSQKCDIGGAVTFNGTVTAGFQQTGSSFIGTATATAALPDEENCQPGSTETIVMLLTGTVSGSTISGTIVVPLLGTFVMTGTVNGTSMTVAANDDLVAVTINVTQSGSGGAPAGLTGAYSGTYTFREAVRNCSNLTVKTYSGPMTGSLVQTGGSLAGFVGITGAKHTDRNGPICTLRDDVGVVPIVISAGVTGNSISGFFIIDEEDPAALSGTVNGSTIAGQAAWAEEDAQLDFTIVRTGTSLIPHVLEFKAEPESITSGQSVTLTWQTLNATGVTIDNGVGSRPPSGSVTVTPTTTTTYTLVASSSGGTATSTARVTVSSGTPANVIVSSLPRGLVQAAGQAGARDSYTLTNVGGSSTAVTLTQTGTFFTHSPTSFTLGAGASQIVTVIATEQPAGSFSGSSNPAGSGVAVGTNVQIRMLVATPPSGPVKARAGVSRFVAISTGSQPAGGQISITNQGTAMMQALLVADVPWITHDTQPITIAAGETRPVSFSVDPNKRPDAPALLGAATGSLSLRFLTGTQTTPGKVATNDATGSGTLSVSIVSVVRPGSTSKTPAPVAPGELAYFVPGMSSKSSAVGDLLLAVRGGAPISGLELFYTASFAGTFYQVSALPQLPATGSIAFPSAVTSVFGNISQTGAIQLRGAQTSKVSPAGTRVNATDGNGTFSGALPLLRSDRGVGAGEQILLTGVQKSAGVQTDLYIQEVSGSMASAQVEFLDGNGVVAGTVPTVNLGAFGFHESVDAVPSNVVTIRVTNTGSGSGRIGAAALVLAPAPGDAWVVEDPTAGLPVVDTFFVPLLSASKESPVLLFAANRTSTPRSFTVDIVTQQSRRRSVKSLAVDDGPVTQEATSYTVGGFATRQITTRSPGFAKIRADAGAVVATARNVVDSAGPGVMTPFGSSIPVVPASAALSNGEGQRFAAVDDASAATRAVSSPGSYRSSLVLLETGGGSATVRVSIAFQFPGSKTTASGQASREYLLTSSQYLVIQDLAGSLIGAHREGFGDLQDMVVDVDVVQGSGRVIPFVVSTDLGSGDMSVRRN